MASEHLEAAPVSKYIGKESTKLYTLDSFVKVQNIDLEGHNILLKMDVQGFEKQVLDGAMESLKKIKGIQLEMSLSELYKGEMLFDEMKEHIKSLGFTLCLLEPGFYNTKNGKLLQVDGVFYRI